jgi:teichuronic acid exporter
MSYAQKTMTGALWHGLSNGGNQLVAFIVYVLLARILSIEEFGLIAFSFLMLELGNVLVNFGINQQLIQRKEWSDDFAKTCFWFLLGLSCCIALFIAGIISPLSSIFYTSEAGIILLFLALVPLLNGVSLVSEAKLQREFKNQQLSVIKLFSISMGGIISVVLALQDFGVWSVVWGRLIQSTLSSLCLFFITSFRPSLQFHKPYVQELMSFGLPLLAIALLRFFAERSMNFIVALFLGNSAFAFVAVAQRGQVMLSQLTITSLNSMLLPSFSRIADEKIEESLYRVLRLSSFLIVPIFVGFAAVSEQFVLVIFGEKWLHSAELLTILPFMIIPMILGWYLPAILISRAHTKAAFNLSLISLAGNLVAATIGSFFGTYGVVIAVTCVTFITVPFRYKIMGHHFDISLYKAISTIIPSTVAALFMFIIVHSLGVIFKISTGFVYIDLACLIVIGSICYILVLSIFFRQYLTQSVNQLKKIRKPKQ